MPNRQPLLNLVLLEPAIPNNTGNIGRTAAATGCRLHIVRPIPFDLSEKACRRAGLDYWPLLDLRVHESWDAFLVAEAPPRLWLYTTKSDRPHWQADYQRGDYLLFGKETAGVGPEIHAWVDDRFGRDHRVTLPMVDDPRARSLNLATAVCAGVYEAARQLDWTGE